MNKRQKTIEKYYRMLKKLHDRLNEDSRISMTEFRKEHGVSFSSISALSKMKIVKHIGSENGVRCYEWITDEPTYKTAEDLANFTSKTTVKKNDAESMPFIRMQNNILLAEKSMKLGEKKSCNMFLDNVVELIIEFKR